MRPGDPVSIALFMAGTGIVIHITFLLSMQKALTRVAPPNRAMRPELVWLMLIPVFNFIWQFSLAARVPDSRRNEFRNRRRDDGGDYGKVIGMTYCILWILSAIASN